MVKIKEVNFTEGNLSKENLYPLIFKALEESHDGLKTAEIYDIIDEVLKKDSKKLSQIGKNSLRKLINTYAVQEGYIYPYSDDGKWHLTTSGKELVSQQGKQKEIVYNQETKEEEEETPNTIKGAILEKYVLGLLKIIHPYYSWFHQGVQKINERGLDLIANRIGENTSVYKTIGVQIKNHKITSSPTEKEWLKFLAGCFVRKIDEVIFVTTGKLNSEQRREAGEAKITVIEGIEELNRIAKLYKYISFDEYLNEASE